jgi:hypothetical protein
MEIRRSQSDVPERWDLEDVLITRSFGDHEAAFVGGRQELGMNSPLTPVTGVRAHRRAIVVHFVVRRKIGHKTIWDFFDSIGQKRQFDDVRTFLR